MNAKPIIAQLTIAAAVIAAGSFVAIVVHVVPLESGWRLCVIATAIAMASATAGAALDWKDRG
jgi:hypothetical protein